MIRLHTFINSLPGAPDPSAFSVKLMTALRLAGVAHERVEESNPAVGPKGKIPFIEDGNVRMGDTTLILDYLKQTRGIDLDRHLTPLQKAHSHALQRMLEERLNWAVAYSRWIDSPNSERFLKTIFEPVPWPIRGLVSRKARKGLVATLHGQGLGRHTEEEIYAFGVADIDTVSTILGEQAFLFGSKPSVADATAFGMLVTIVGPDLPSPLKDAIKNTPNLMSYVERMQVLFDDAAPNVALKAA